MDSILDSQSGCAGTFRGVKSAGLILSAVAIVILGAWSSQAAELLTPKKPKPPATAAPTAPPAKSSPNLKGHQIGSPPQTTPSGSDRSGTRHGPSIPTTTTREPVPNQGSEAVPCGKSLPSLKGLGKVPRTSGPCAGHSEPGGEPAGQPESEPGDESESEPDTETDSSPPPPHRGGPVDGTDEGDSAGDYGNEGRGDSEYSEGRDGEYRDSPSDSARSSSDFDELTGKIPGFKPFGGEESGSSEGSSIQGGRPWYERLGKPGGGGGPPPANDSDNEPDNE